MEIAIHSAQIINFLTEKNFSLLQLYITKKCKEPKTQL